MIANVPQVSALLQRCNMSADTVIEPLDISAPTGALNMLDQLQPDRPLAFRLMSTDERIFQWQLTADITIPPGTRVFIDGNGLTTMLRAGQIVVGDGAALCLYNLHLSDAKVFPATSLQVLMNMERCKDISFADECYQDWVKQRFGSRLECDQQYGVPLLLGLCIWHH